MLEKRCRHEQAMLPTGKQGGEVGFTEMLSWQRHQAEIVPEKEEIYEENKQDVFGWYDDQTVLPILLPVQEETIFD